MHISCALASGLFMPHPLRRHETVIEANRMYWFTVQRFIKERPACRGNDLVIEHQRVNAGAAIDKHRSDDESQQEEGDEIDQQQGVLVGHGSDWLDYE